MDGEAEVLDQTIDADVSAADADVSQTDVQGQGTDASQADTGQEVDAGQQKEQQADHADARALPKEIQKTLKALKENPETAKVARALNDAYFREQAYAKHGKPAEIAAMAATLSRLGGEEGIAELEQKVASMDLVDADIAKGDPGFLDDIIETAPEGFKKLVPAALGKLYNLDKVAYGHAVAPVIYGTLKNYRLPEALSILEKSTDANVKPVYETLKQLASDLEEEVRNAPRQEDTNARDEVSKERDALTNERYEMQAQDVGRTTLGYQDTLINRSLAPLLKTHPLGADTKSDLVGGISREIASLLKGDSDYQSHVKAALAKIRETVANKGDTQALKDSVAKYINAKMDEIAPRAVKTVWNRRYGGFAKKTTPTNGAAAASGPRMGQKPAMADIIKVPNWETLFVAHKAYVMKNGKETLVSW